MKPMLFAFVAIVVIAIAADRISKEVGISSQDRNAGADVRLSGS